MTDLINNISQSKENIEKKFPFKKRYYKDFSPVRSACLFVVKALTKLVEEMHNTVYFDFDADGLILRASDKESLAKAKQRLEYWKDQTQIGILIDYIDKDDYKKFIDNELQTLWKKERAFINVISYDKFLAACEFLEKKGYKEPLKKYAQIYAENKNFSLLMATKHRFEEIKSRIYELLKPLRKDKLALKKKNLSSQNQAQSQVHIVQKPGTWEDNNDSSPAHSSSQSSHLGNTHNNSSSKYNNNNDMNPFLMNENDQFFSNLEMLGESESNKDAKNYYSQYNNSSDEESLILNNKKNEKSLTGKGYSNNDEGYDEHFPDMSLNDLNSNIGSSNMKEKLKQKSKSQTTKNNISQLNEKQSSLQPSKYKQSSFSNTNNNNTSSNKNTNQTTNIKKKPISLNSNSEEYQIQQQNQVYQDQNGNKQQKYQFQIKIVVWLIFSGILKQDLFKKIQVQVDEDDEDTYLEFIVTKNSKKDNKNSNNNNEDDNLDEKEENRQFQKICKQLQGIQNFVETTLQMRVVFANRPIEVYQYMVQSIQFQVLFAQSSDIIDLFSVEKFKQTVNYQIKNQLIQNKASQYLLSKMEIKKNFCFLIASRKKFAEIQTQLMDLEKTVVPSMIKPLYIDYYQPLFDQFPGNVQDKRIKDLEKKFNMVKKLGPEVNITKSSHLQDFYSQQANQQDGQKPPVIELFYNSTPQFYVKKIKNVREYELMKICKNLRLQNFFQSDFIVQQFGIKVMAAQQQLKQSQQILKSQKLQDVYCFYEVKKCNFGKVIIKKSFKSPEQQLNAARQMIEALGFLHNNRLRPMAHGNIKPENILLDDKNNIQLTDISSELNYSRFLAPEFIAPSENFKKILKNSYNNQQQYQNQSQNNSGKNNNNNSQNKQQQQQQNDLYENEAQNIIRKQQLHLVNMLPDFKSDLWSLGLMLYSLFTGEITDTFCYLQKSRQNIENIMLENTANLNSKKFLKLTLQLVDEIMTINPEHRPDIQDIQERIEKLIKLF